ncbi:MAG: insulinase family protein, partial [Thiomargarita sp.]|nr:insulinase family protein [Thiomargarita sp.]
HYNSGGEPKEIPKLTHAQLKAFHATHYHPSNAIFMTYGGRSAAEHQSVFEERALKDFKKTVRLQIPDEKRYDKPLQATNFYPLDKTEDNKNKTHTVLAWLLGKSSDIQEVMNATLLTGILLDNSASPLYHVLETTELGIGPSPLCGFDDSSRESSFMCGLEGSNPEQADEVEALIFKVLEDVANKGVPLSQVESVLHQIELSQREITGGAFPYGLRLLVNALSPMIHGGDPVAFLDIDPVLNHLREKCQDPNFIPKLVRQLLLDNQHRVRVVMAPEKDLAAQELLEEKTQLETLQAGMTVADKSKVLEQTTALEIHQQKEEDPDILPKVGLEDVAADLKIPEGTTQTVNELPATWFASGTNGMVYQTLVVELPEFETELLDIFPLFCNCLTEVGCGDQTYRETAAQQAAEIGGISARISLRANLSDVQIVRSFFILSGKALERNQAALAKSLRDTLEQARFDELPRLRELIAQMRAASDNSVTSRGHQLAMTACSSGMSPAGYYNSQWHGLLGMQRLKILDDSLENEDNLKAFANKFTRIRNKLIEAPRELLVVSEVEHHNEIANIFKQLHWNST